MIKVTPEIFHRRLERLARRRLVVTLTENASDYVSFRPGATPLRVRMHHSFLYAPRGVMNDLGRWLRTRSQPCPESVQRFIDDPPSAVRRALRRHPVELQPQGQCYNLEQILRQENARRLGSRVRVRITWGCRRPGRAVRSRTLGVYYPDERLIVMNPVLDQWSVPRWFVAYTVYHEMLHAVQPRNEAPHGPWFGRALERHPRHRDAERWEAENLRLLTAGIRTRRGTVDALLARHWREYLDIG